MKLSLRNKFLIPTLSLILIGLGAAIGISYYNSKNAIYSAYQLQLKQIVDSTGQTVSAWINDRRLDIASWSEQKGFQTAIQASFVGKAARKTSNIRLAKLKEHYTYYENICLATPDGEILSAADTAVIGKVNLKERPYFQEVLKGATALSQVVQSKGSGNPVFVIAAPITVKEKIAGVLLGVIDLSRFSATFIDPVKVGNAGYAYIYREDGTVIAHPDRTVVLKLNMNEFDFGREMMTKSEGYTVYTWKGVEKAVAYKKDPETGWTIGVGVDTATFLAPINRVGLINLAVVGIIAVLAAGMIFVVSGMIVKSILKISGGLIRGADQGASAADQVSNSSQQLSDGASRQAASIEESSSSLEEMAAMTKQNAASANQANSLMREANEVVEQANDSMTDLTASMDEISKAGEETSKIIKTIDEIAFQTNLLALNAAVEAARAGEAGAGFAVVADEVRNLAMRAADAARNTSELIEGTVKKTKDGTDLVSKTNEAFAKVAVSTSKVGELVGEIAAASSEQAQGIEQINRAVQDMDKITQQNAATAEESASASGEMNSQSVQMKSMVDDLVVLINGRVSGSTKKGSGSTAKKTNAGVVGAIDNDDRARAGRLKSRAAAGFSTGRQKPPQIMPPADDEFSDF